MLIQRLVEYSGRLDLPPAMYDKTPVRWFIDLAADGSFMNFVQTSSGKKNDRGKEILAPTRVRASGIRAKLLCDNGEYVLGVPRENSAPERVRECHEAFVALVAKCQAEVGEPDVEAICSFLGRLDLKTLPLGEGFDPSQNVTFRVDGRLPMELTSVRSFWVREVGGGAEAKGEASCLACGVSCVPTERMPVKVKRVPGGQASGMTLVSANAAAFESYGLEASTVSPLCARCAELHAKALNDLLEKEDCRIFLGPLAYAFWTREEQVFSPATFLSSPQAGEVKELLASARAGRPACVDETAFFAVALSASGGRVVVRDWLETTVHIAKRNLARWFRLQALVENDGTDGHPLGIFPLASSLVRDARKDLSPQVPQHLLRVALHGGPLPSSLLFEAVRRNRAEQAVTRPRAALIKMIFLSQMGSLEEGTMEKLDANDHRPAYLCGRLLAELEALQYAALGSTNTTVTGRFYGTASSAPASVFGRLMRGAQPHLNKLRASKPGTYDALQRKLEEIQANLPSYPLVLTLEEQGLFALGYYHQRAQDRAERSAYAEAKKAAAEKAE